LTHLEFLTPAVDVLAKVHWLQTVQALAPVATAVIALLALRNWQRQDKAKRESEYLDELIEASHTYLVKMSSAVSYVRFVEIGMASHVAAWDEGDQTVNGAIKFIKSESGKSMSGSLREALHSAQPSMVRLRTLAIKGQIYQFKDYDRCDRAVNALTWQYDRISAISSVIGSPSSNFENPRIQSLLKDTMRIKKDDVQSHLAENNSELIKFVQDAYARLYG
jgi:hypothetical protein